MHVSDVMPTNSRPLPLLKVSILPPDVSPNDLLNQLRLSGVFVRGQLQILALIEILQKYFIEGIVPPSPQLLFLPTYYLLQINYTIIHKIPD
jgi:hypothetical protein